LNSLNEKKNLDGHKNSWGSRNYLGAMTQARHCVTLRWPLVVSLLRTVVVERVGVRQRATEQPAVDDRQVGAVHDYAQLIGRAEAGARDVIDDVSGGEEARLVDGGRDAGRASTRVRHQVVVRYVELTADNTHIYTVRQKKVIHVVCEHHFTTASWILLQFSVIVTE